MPSRSSSAGEGRRIVVDAVGQAADLRRRHPRARPRGRRAARPAPRTAGRGGPSRATSRTAIAATSRAPAPSAVSASRTAAAPRAIASPCWAADQPSADLVGLAGPEPGRGDLVRFVLEEVDPPGQLARVDRQLRERGPVRAPALDHVGHRGTSRGMPAERVEQVALPALVEQALLVVLAVDLDQRPDLVGEPGGGRGDVVEPGGRPAAGRHLADRDERLGKPVEEGLDPRRLGAVADEGRVRARPGRARGRRSAGSCPRRSRR